MGTPILPIEWVPVIDKYRFLIYFDNGTFAEATTPVMNRLGYGFCRDRIRYIIEYDEKYPTHEHIIGWSPLRLSHYEYAKEKAACIEI